MAKDRPDAFYSRLSAPQRQQLLDWLMQGNSLQTCVDLVGEKFDVDSSTSAMHRFYSKYGLPERRRRAMAAVMQIDADQTDGELIDAATLQSLREMSLDALSQPGTPIDEVKELITAALNMRKVAAKEGDLRAKMQELTIKVEKHEAQMAEARALLESERKKGSGGLSEDAAAKFEEGLLGK